MNSPAHASLLSRLAFVSAFVALLALFSFSALDASAANKKKKPVAATNCPTAIAAVNRTVKRVALRKVEVKYLRTTNKKRKLRAQANLKKARNGAAAARAAVRKYCGPTSGVSAWSGPCFRAIDSYTSSLTAATSTKLKTKRVKKGSRGLSKKQARRRKKILKLQNAKVKHDLQTLQLACAVPTNNGGGNTNPGNTTITGPTKPVKDNPVIVVTPSNPSATLECKLDNGAFAVVTSPYVPNTAGLAEGVHTVTCHSVVGGVAGPDSSYSFTIDRTAPSTTIGVQSPTGDPTPAVTLTSSEPGTTFECKLDGGPFGPTPASFDLPPLTANVDHTLTCRGTDAAGNVGPEQAKTVRYDTLAPDLDVTGPTGAINTSTPAYEVSTTDDTATIKCDADGGPAVVVPSGSSFSPSLSEGAHVITCTATDPAGNATTVVKNVTVDTTAPSATLTGPSGPTNTANPVYVPTTTDGTAVIKCSVDGGAQTTVASGANYSPGPLGQGVHTITCVTTDPAGNATPKEKLITVDTVAPTMTISAATPTNDSTPAVSLTASEAGVTFECKLDGGSYAASAANFDLPTLTVGDHTLVCRATDAAGNVGPAQSKTITYDPNAPGLTMTGPEGAINTTTPAYLVTADPGATIKCSVDGGAEVLVPSGNSYSPSLSQGAHSITCVATDLANNSASQTKNVTVDTTAPGISVAGPSGPTNTASPLYTPTTSDATALIMCSVDGGTPVPVASGGSYSPGPLSQGVHAVSCVATDPAGNTSTGGKSVTVDTIAPAATLTGPAGDSNNANPVYVPTTTDGAATIKCSVDGGAQTTVLSGANYSPGPLTEGTHTINCVTTDPAGNSTPTSKTVTIDTTAPGVSVAGPAGPTNNINPVYTPTTVDATATIKCSVDGGAATTVASGASYSPGPLSAGAHTITCVATDPAGNTSSASKSPTVDTVAPTTLIAGPTTTNDTTPSFTVTPSEAGSTSECKVDGGSYSAAAAGVFTTAALSDGAHTVTCRSTDAAGNIGNPVSQVVTIDTTAPTTTVAGPSGPTNDNTPTYTVSSNEPGGTSECKVDGGGYQSTSGGSFTASTLSDGPHTITCRAVDAAGNPGNEVVKSITVDTVAPTTTVAGPAGPTNDNTPTYTVSSNEPGGTSQCKVDGGAYQATTAGSFTPAALGDGAHTITCRAVDAAGNPGNEVVKSITVDTVGPTTTVVGPAVTNDTTPTFAADINEPGTSECKVDGGAYAPIVGGIITTGVLSEGAHTVTCRSTDAVGNVGAPFTKNVTIDTTAPVTTMTGPSGLQNDSTPTYTLGANEVNVTFECKVDGGAFASVGNPYTTPDLVEGFHTISCRAIDAAGNVGPAVSKTTTIGNPYTDPVTKTINGGWGLACTPLDFLLPLGCPAGVVSHTIPSHPNGLTGNYTVDLTGAMNNLCSVAGVFPTYTLSIVVDGVAVASQSKSAFIELFCIGGTDLAAQKLNLSLSSATSHTISLNLKSSSLLSVVPIYSSASLTIDIDQL